MIEDYDFFDFVDEAVVGDMSSCYQYDECFGCTRFLAGVCSFSGYVPACFTEERA